MKKESMNMPIFLCFRQASCSTELQQAIEEELGSATLIPSLQALPEQIAVLSQPSSILLITDGVEVTDHHCLGQISIPITHILYTTRTLSEVIERFAANDLRNIVIQRDVPQSLQELIITLKKLITQEILGIERYVSSHPITRKTLTHSEERYEVIEGIWEFMSPYVKNPRFKEATASVLEELFMNAFYSAPIDENRHRLYETQDRAVPVNLPSGKRVHCDYAYDGSELIIAVGDPYGSFEYPILIDSLVHHFRGDLKIREGEGGAGIGLREVFQNSGRLVVNIDRNHCTEMMAFLDLSIRFSQHQRRPRSLNIFTK